MHHPFLYKYALVSSILILPLMLGGCTESEDEAPPSLAGIYTRAADSGTTAADGLTLIDAQGDIITLSPQGAYSRGQIWSEDENHDRSDISGRVNVWDGHWLPSHIFGVRDYDGSLQGEFVFPNSAGVHFSFIPQHRLYHQHTSYRDLHDTWSEWNPVAGVTTTFSIDHHGYISGSDSTGCLFSGSLAIPDRSYNLVRVSVTAEFCGGRHTSEVEGTYTGMGYLADSDADGYRDRLVLLMDNGRLPVVYVMDR